MRFLTIEEARARCGEMVRFDARGRPLTPRHERLYARAPLPGVPALTDFCRELERALQPWEACLLWVTDWGIWSSDNLHLYYRLRQSYGDLRLLDEAPAHLFLDYEAADLVSFLEVGIISGWDMHLIPFAGYARAFVSHDEFVEFAAEEGNPDLVHEWAAKLGGAEVRTTTPSS
jgi:hypothetical protein